MASMQFPPTLEYSSVALAVHCIVVLTFIPQPHHVKKDNFYSQIQSIGILLGFLHLNYLWNWSNGRNLRFDLKRREG